MGSLFDSPKPQPLPPPPPPAPAPTISTATVNSNKAQDNALARQGRASDILTGAGGDLTQVSTSANSAKKLLGQ